MIAAAIAIVGTAATATGQTGPPTATRDHQTYPRVVPREAGQRSRVAVYFTLADAPGHQGIVASSYRIGIARPPGARAACAPASPPGVEQGTKDAIARVALARPASGWCAGRYTVKVFLQRGPYCPEPAPGEPPAPCPLFASQDLDAGRAHFTVRSDRTG